MIVVFQFQNESIVLACVHFHVQHHFEEVRVMFLTRSQQIFPVKDHIVIILGFMDHVVFVETAAIAQKQPQAIHK